MTSILCCPETVHFSTKDAYTSEITFLAFFLIVRYCSFLPLTSLYGIALSYAWYHCKVLLFPTPYILVQYYSILSCISSYVTNLSYTLYHCIVRYCSFLHLPSLHCMILTFLTLYYCTVFLFPLLYIFVCYSSFLRLTLLYGTALIPPPDIIVQYCYFVYL